MKISKKNETVTQRKDSQGQMQAQTWDPGFGVLHFLMLQTVLKEKLIFPHFGHVQSLSRVESNQALEE